ncbi:MAG: sulfotransferase domain-containing protein [Anaerolineales bacterium]|nr:sulfotransferase domain-containing protein [Anaerolineales bacterium]
MIVLSVGMPRAGSGWHYNLVHDLVVAAGGQNAREIRRRFLLGPVLTEVNCNIGALTTKRLLPVLVPSLLGNTFVIKAHAGPKPYALRLIENGRMRTTYIYRDPRAALLSAYEYGQRGLKDGRVNAFGHLTDIDTAIEFMLEYVDIWEAWMAEENVLHVRYEDLLGDYDLEMQHLADFLDIDAQLPAVVAVADKYRPGQNEPGQKGLHFHKGQPERFRTALTAAQLEACAQAFGPYLERMGYEL